MQVRTVKVQHCLYKAVICYRNPKMAKTDRRQYLSLPNTRSYESLLSYLQFLGRVTALVDIRTLIILNYLPKIMTINLGYIQTIFFW